MDDIQNDENQNQIDDHEEAVTGMEEVDAFDFERAVMLMGVLEKCANIGVKSTAISGLAAAALNEMNEEAKLVAKRRAEAFAQLERKRDEALAAQRAEQEAAEQEARDDAEAARPRAIPAPQPTRQPAPDNRRL